jgi:hypothetical protein
MSLYQIIDPNIFSKTSYTIQSYLEVQKRGPKPGSLKRTRDEAKVRASGSILIVCQQLVKRFNHDLRNGALSMHRCHLDTLLQHLKKAARVVIDLLCSVSQKHSDLKELGNRSQEHSASLLHPMHKHQAPAVFLSCARFADFFLKIRFLTQAASAPSSRRLGRSCWTY